MNKRTFMKLAGAAMASPYLGRALAWAAAEKMHNWAGNLEYSTDQVFTATSVEQVRESVKKNNKLKALGSRHCFNNIADSKDAFISLKPMDRVIALDPLKRTVTVGAGITYGQLCPYLDEKGFALHNLASLPHISVVGACSTATHGSGEKNGNLSTAVSALEMVTADGKVVTLSQAKDGDIFPGAVVSLGALGIITKITLNLLPTFQMRQEVYENLSFDQLEHNLDTIFGSGYSVSLFTDWQNNSATQVWIKNRVEAGAPPQLPPLFYGATLATHKLHPIAGHDATPCTEQMGIPAPWYERMPHFRMNFTPSSGAELQTEYFVPREHGYEAILAVEKLRDRITPHLFVTELRTIAADDLWMSMAYQRDSMAIPFTWKPEWNDVEKVLPLIEEKLQPFDARPHWAKLFTTPQKRLQQLYPKFLDFQALAKRYDPDGKFRNDFLHRNLYGGSC